MFTYVLIRGKHTSNSTKYYGALPSSSKKHRFIFNHPRETLWEFGRGSHLIGRRIREGYTVHILCEHDSSEEKAASRKIFSRSSLSLDFRSRPPLKKSKSICAVLLHLLFLFRVVLQPSPVSEERIVERHDRCVSGFLLIWLTQQGKKKGLKERYQRQQQKWRILVLSRPYSARFSCREKNNVIFFLGQCLTLASARCTSPRCLLRGIRTSSGTIGRSSRRRQSQTASLASWRRHHCPLFKVSNKFSKKRNYELQFFLFRRGRNIFLSGAIPT